jgi:hypothetical protein
MAGEGGQVAAAAAPGAPAAAAGGEAAGEQQSPFTIAGFIKGLIFRALIFYVIANFFRRPSTPQGPDGGVGAPAGMKPASNLFQNGTMMDLYVYLSEDEVFSDFGDSSKLIWLQEQLYYGDWTAGEAGDGSFVKELSVPTSRAVQNNGSIYLHTYFVLSGKSPDPAAASSKLYLKRYTIAKTHRLNKYKRKKHVKTQNLLTGQTAASPEDERYAENPKGEIVSHWHPNLTINIVNDHTPWTPGGVPTPLADFVEFTGDGTTYKPIVFFNTYWNLLREYQPINDTVKTLNLTLTYQPISLFKWQMYSAQQMRNKWMSGLIGDALVEEEDEDQDSLKEALLETSPYLLGITFVVSILHTVFEFLAFKNDIQFWKNKKNLEGLSVRSVLFNLFQSGIVMLYIFDNDANTIIRISVVVGLFIDLWKIPKVLDITVDRDNKVLGIFPRISFADKGSYVESSTKEFDDLAFKYLSIALFPLLAGFGVYSLMYNEHRGWYSFVLNMLYGFLLTFGFIMMTPQLFINYKMKSVAHLPWRMLTYKFINTFIDDLFAFVIKMPTLYRIGCFRDDVVFFIFLYQRYIYRVDPKRTNEFGFSKEELDQQDAEAKANGQVGQGDAQQLAVEDSAAARSPASDDERRSDDASQGSAVEDAAEPEPEAATSVRQRKKRAKNKGKKGGGNPEES